MIGETTKELAWFVKAGMTPAQALASATTIPAALLGHENDLGAVAPGYFADIVAVDGDPLADINNVINRVVWVMKGGSVVVDASERTIRDTVERFLLHLGDHQFDEVANGLAPKAVVVVTRQRDGAWTNSYQTGEEWVAALKKNPNPVTFREPITNVAITIDSNQLAYVRANFTVTRDGQPQSQGVDQFTLVREAAGWKIAAVAYTSMAVGR